MTSRETDLIYAFETHSAQEIRAILDSGVDASKPIDGKSPINWLTEMYFRSDRFPDCLRLLLDHGAVLDDPILEPVLRDDAVALSAAIDADPALVERRTNMVSSFSPLHDATLLHVAAEYGNARAAKVLIDHGADVDAAAGIDEHGLNGHTPIFHTVCSLLDHSRPVMDLLLDGGARCDILLPGIVWGKGFEWETTCFDVTPISYCQFGLLPQVHRRESEIYANIERLMRASGRSLPPLQNVPNRYLQPRNSK
jgi:hypothetical protein